MTTAVKSTTLMTTYNRLDVAFERGEGVWIWDTDGRRYLDALSGIAVCGLGHAHPRITEAISRQASQLLHTSNLYRIELQEQLGARLTARAGMDRVFFSNSGAEANEAAIKLARLYGHNRGVDRPVVVAMDGSFHGRTMATLSATGNPKVHAGFEPLVEGFVHVPFGDAQAVKTVMASNSSVVAILVEPVQGEGGVVVPPAGYLAELRALADEHGVLLMVDEIQTGMCRTGRWFGVEHDGVHADVMTLAKALGNGVPIGACLARGAASEVLQPGTHGSTFGGNPLASAAALAVLDTLEQDQLVERAAEHGQWMADEFKVRLSDVASFIADIRGRGLMIGIELKVPCGGLVQQALDAGILINVTAGNTIRLLPPLIINQAEAEEIVAKVSELIIQFAQAEVL